MTNLNGNRIPMGTIGTIPTGSEPHPCRRSRALHRPGSPFPVRLNVGMLPPFGLSIPLTPSGVSG